jgi:predicted DNA-binding transcriptional regulator YafY
MTSTGRLLALLSLLQARRDWPGALLAERLEVSERTVRRDVDRLRALGYTVRAAKGPDGGYRLDAGGELPPLLLDDDQVVALTIALGTAAATGAGIAEDAQRALAVVRQVLPARLRPRVEAVTAEVSRRTGGEADPAVLVAVSAATRASEVLRFDYPPAAADAPPRRAEPHALVVRGGRWYLIAWDLDRDDWRTFRVDRIAPRSHTGGRFRPRALPGGDAVAFLEGRFRGNPGAGDWPCRGEVLLARSAEEVAPFVEDGTVEAIAPERCRVVLGSWSWPALAARIGMLEAEVEVIGPAELRSAFAELSRRFADAVTAGTAPRPTRAGRPASRDGSPGSSRSVP